ncbi:MAG: hypothetical protein V1487_02240 [bacterium]
MNSGRKITSKKNKLVELAKWGGVVFTAQDLAVIWGYTDERKLFETIKYYVRRKEMFAISRGLYAGKDYCEKEIRGNTTLQYQIANKLIPNSYVSLYTVLKSEGVIDQYYDGVYSVAGRKASRVVRGVKFEYRRVRGRILWSDWGVNKGNGARVASLERAVLDTWYCEPDWELGRVEKVDVLKLKEGAKLYGGKVMRRVKEC